MQNLPDDQLTPFERHLVSIGRADQADAHRARRAAELRDEEARIAAASAAAERDRERERLALYYRDQLSKFLGLGVDGAPPLLNAETRRKIRDAVKAKLGRPAFEDRPTIWENGRTSVEKIAALLDPTYAAIFLAHADEADITDPTVWGMVELVDGEFSDGALKLEMNAALRSIGWRRNARGVLAPPMARPGEKNGRLPKPSVDGDEQMLAFIAAHPGPVKRGDVYRGLGGSRSVLVERLDALIASGRVVETKSRNAKLVVIAPDHDDD